MMSAIFKRRFCLSTGDVFDQAGSAASRFHSFVYIFLRRFRKESELFAIRRIVRCKCRAVTGWYKITVDKKSVLFLDVCYKNDLPFRNGREKIRVQGSRFRVSPWGVVPFDSV